MRRKRQFGTAAISVARWATNPVSERGVVHLFRAAFAVSGPTLTSRVKQMRSHPEGAWLLAHRPDLGMTLADQTALAAMPNGSLGRAYHDFMSGPSVVPGYYIAGLLYRDGGLDETGWNDDMKYLYERIVNTHDMVHVLSGYGTDFAAEFLNLVFTLGLLVPVRGRLRRAALGRFIGVESGLVGLPRFGLRRWTSVVGEAYERGNRAGLRHPFESFAFEEHLSDPLDDVRATLGIVPPAAPVDSADWIRNPIIRRLASGYGKAGGIVDRAAVVKTYVDAGMPLRDAMNR